MGPLGVGEYAHQMLLDLTVHGWDLATGAGVAYRPVADAIEDGIAYEQPLVQAGQKTAIFAAPTGYRGPDRLGVRPARGPAGAHRPGPRPGARFAALRTRTDFRKGPGPAQTARVCWTAGSGSDRCSAGKGDRWVQMRGRDARN